MRKTILRSCYQDEQPMMEPALTSEAAWQETIVGFRLAHDSADRVCRGGRLGRTAQNARVAYRCGYDPGVRFDGLGFRLVRDEEV